MSAPSLDHERRLWFLETMADLLGCTTPTPLDDECRPDVVRVDLRRARLLVGDAKHSETPSCAATRKRLLRYVNRSSSWCRAGFVAVIAVCHDRQWEAQGWLDLLRDIVDGNISLQPVLCGSASFDSQTTVTWLEARYVALPSADRQDGGAAH